MAIFPSMTITNLGQLLYNKAQAGAALNFTKMKLGAGRLADGQDPQTVPALIDYKFDVAISSITQNTELKVAVITGSRNNADVTEGTYICELGLYALDPDAGEILYAYANAADQGDYFAPASKGAFTWSYQINAAVGNAADVTATLSSNAFDHAIAISDTSFVTIAGTTQKEINKNIDAKLTAHATQLAETATQLVLKAPQTALDLQESRIDNLVATPNSAFYQKSTNGVTGALLVVSSGATAGQINLTSVTPLATGYTAVAGDYVLLVYGVASGSAELIDARTGADGVTYANIGGSIRGQVGQLKETISSNEIERFTEIAVDITKLTNYKKYLGKCVAGVDTETKLPIYSDDDQYCSLEFDIPMDLPEIVLLGVGVGQAYVLYNDGTSAYNYTHTGASFTLNLESALSQGFTKIAITVPVSHQFVTDPNYVTIETRISDISKSIANPVANILTNGAIEVNLLTKTLTSSSCLVAIPNDKSAELSVTAQTLDITSVANDPTKRYTFYIDTSTKVINFTIYSGNIPSTAWVLFSLYSDAIVALNHRSVKLVNPTGAEVNRIYNPYDYNERLFRLLLPDDMYFTDLTLPIYKSSFISNAGNLDIFKTALINIQSDNTPRINYFDEDYLLDGTKLSNTFQLAIAQKHDANYDYLKTITKHYVSSSANFGKTANYIAMGDSITAHNIAPMLQSKMWQWDVNVNILGTLFSCEGRSGWRWKDFIGLSNRHVDGTVITRSESGSTTTLYQNPFLKLASDTDKANHPDWCFRNTGAETELSYTQDTDKTGNFYIFDFAWYLSSHGITAPDIITIALGTNDIWHDSDSLANSRLGLDIMVKQIKTALPNAKIGIIPSPSWEYDDTYDNNNYWTNKVPDWIDNCMTDVRNLKTTYNNLYTIGIWAHMSRFFIWDYDTSENLTSTNNSQKSHKGDRIHHNDYGKMEYINALSSWLMNII